MPLFVLMVGRPFGGNVQKEIVVQIGTFRLRDNTKHFAMPTPIFKSLPLKVAERFCDNTAKLLVDCYQEHERIKAVQSENTIAV